MRFLFLYIIIGLLNFSGGAQSQYDPESFRSVPHIEFQAHDNQLYGFDGYQYPHDFGRFDKLIIKKNIFYPIPNKSVGFQKTDKVNAVLKNVNRIDREKLLFLVNDSSEQINFQLVNDTLFTLNLPLKDRDYIIFARYKGRLIGKLKVEVYKTVQQEIVLVNLMELPVNQQQLQADLNFIYKQANVEVKIRSIIHFSDSVFNAQTVFDNPSSRNDRYTKQMRELRDRFFEAHPNFKKNAIVLFLIPGFNDEGLQGYMTRNKAMAFLKYDQEGAYNINAAKELARGIGMLDHYWITWKTNPGMTANLMDNNNGIDLNQAQWVQLRHSSNSFSFYDGDEDVKTNNGMVAYYFWEEDELGKIRLNGDNPLSLISRPFKKNYLSYHLNVSDLMFTVIASYNTYFLCYWHVLIWTLLFSIWLLFRWRIKRRIRQLPMDQGRIKLRLIKWVSAPIFLALFLFSYQYINEALKKYEVNSGQIDEFSGQSMDFVKNNILNNTNLRYRVENQLSSEILVKRNGQWQMKRRKKVLYFDVFRDSTGNFDYCIFRRDSDTLSIRTLDYSDKAESHYLVFSYLNESDSLEGQKAFNHIGVEISNKVDIEDAAKRILVFINGYRPTSVGHSFEDNFSDIKNNGFEFPQSSNLIYSFDRYDYWRPWNQIDALFKKKIGETEYGLGWFPMGGYVKISGMIDESMDEEAMKLPPQPWEFRSKPAWQRLIIMLGGIIVNIILAIFIYSMILLAYGEKKLPIAEAKYGYFYKKFNY